ncbi:MAG: hypothetical protein OER91_08525 [Gammaproteobacteria bacterium]|nr:hypothetical protein [Gammaproteobacteria bacterium]
MNRLRTFALAVAVFSSLSITVTAAADEPVIAPEIGRLIAEDSLDAAKTRFKELLKTDSLNHTAEIQALHSLMSAYMQAGNMEAGSAVGEMSAELTMQMMSSGGAYGMPGMDMQQLQQMEDAQKAQEEAERQEEQKLAAKQEQQSRGKSREDLQRFTGFYGEPGSNDMGKTVFVAVSCDGYLVTGPMWADVGAWWMRSAADSVFTYSDSWTDLSLEFVQDGNDGHHTLKNDIDGIGAALEWKKELTPEYAKCVERPLR